MKAKDEERGEGKVISQEEFERRLQNLRDFDLSPVTRRLEEKGIKDAEELEKKFKRFIKMKMEHPDETVAPSPKLDKFWHEFILDTPRYHKFCDQVFGWYFHHVPGDPYEKDIDEYRENIDESSVNDSKSSDTEAE